MSSSSRQLPPVSRHRALAWAVALAMGASAVSGAHAARLGHARVVSAPGAPLQVSVPVLELTPDEESSLQVTLAPATAWQAAGLTPPAPLSSLRLRVEPGTGGSRTVIVAADQPPARDAVDVLLNLRSSAGERLVQVTILVPARTTPEIQRATTGQAPASASSGNVRVRTGDTLYGIAQRNAVPDATIYQMLVALWRANPNAFIDNNMNRVRAGQTLAVPDAATVRAIDPAEARRIYIEQVEAYARWRARLGGSAADARVGGAPASAGRVSGPETGGNAQATPNQDRLRLSGGAAANPGDAAADSRTSEGRALSDAQQRVDTLQSNVQALNEASGNTSSGQGAAGQGAAGQGAAGQGAAGQGAASQGAAGQGAAGQGAAGQGAASQGAAGQGAAGPGAAGQGAAGQGTAGQGAAGQGAAGQGAAGQGAAGQGAAGQGAAGQGAAGQGAAGQGAAGQGAAGQGAAGQGAAGQGAAGQGAAGQGGAGQGAAGQGAAGQGAAGQGAAGTGAAAGANTASAIGGGSGSSASGSGSSAGAGSPIVVPNAPASTKPKDSASGMPSWLADNLLAIVTAFLALIVFIIAWALRRAGTRRGDDDEETPFTEPAPLNEAALNRRLNEINLDLDQPPTDERRPGSTRT